MVKDNSKMNRRKSRKMIWRIASVSVAIEFLNSSCAMKLKGLILSKR